MAINDNTTGVGTLARVAWTPLEGTGLSAAERGSVTQDAINAEVMAQALLDAANSAFNLGWSRFSLDDLTGVAGLAGGAYLARTNLRLSTTSTADDTAGDWSVFIGQALRSGPAADLARSLGDWRNLAADLQRFAALQASKRNPADGSAGGITHSHGQWYANGQALSLTDLYTAVRVNQAANFDDSLDYMVSDLQAINRRVSAAREWASQVRLRKGNGTAILLPIGAVFLNSTDAETFKAKWGIDPRTEYHSKNLLTTNTGYEASWNIWTTDIKAYIDTADKDSQTLQKLLEQKSNRRSEVLEALTSFAGKQSKTGNLMAGNLS